MSEPFENLYFNWLCAKVMMFEPSTPSLQYWTLFRTLHNVEFVWLIIGDDNRAMDGIELRREFIIAADLPDDPQWRTFDECSVLEMFVAFSRRVEFQTDMPAREWIWEFIDNLGMKDFNEASGVSSYRIEEILDRFVWRTYEYNGFGGIFPLENPKRDQRDVELWYQFCDYLVDTGRMD